MTKFNKALLAAGSSIVLFGVALTLITPAPAKAGFDWGAFADGLNDAAQEYNDTIQRQTDWMLDRQRNCTTTFSGNTARTSCW